MVRKRRICSRVKVTSAASLTGRWVKTPSRTTPGRSTTSRASSGASAGLTPTRPIPVSTFRWTERRTARLAHGLGERLGLLARADGEREARLDGGPHLPRKRRAELEDREPQARLAQLEALGHRRDAEPVGRAGRFGHPRDLDRAVAVAVRLHGDEDLPLRADRGADGAEVVPDVPEVDARVGGVEEAHPRITTFWTYGLVLAARSAP